MLPHKEIPAQVQLLVGLQFLEGIYLTFARHDQLLALETDLSFLPLASSLDHFIFLSTFTKGRGGQEEEENSSWLSFKFEGSGDKNYFSYIGTKNY